jgi:hypothetical protein
VHPSEFLALVVEVGVAIAALGFLAVLTVDPLILMAFGAFPAFASGLFFTFMAFALAQAAFAFVLVLDALIWREFK